VRARYEEPFLRAALAALAALAISLGLAASEAAAYTASKVWFEFHAEKGFYRVFVNYTVPELKERREAYVEFRSKKEAEKYYWDLVKGADFYPPDPVSRKFVTQPAEPEPW